MFAGVGRGLNARSMIIVIAAARYYGRIFFFFSIGFSFVRKLSWTEFHDEQLGFYGSFARRNNHACDDPCALHISSKKLSLRVYNGVVNPRRYNKTKPMLVYSSSSFSAG